MAISNIMLHDLRATQEPVRINLAMKIMISAKDLELIALQQVRARPEGENVQGVRVERSGQTWALVISARDGADLNRLQSSVQTVERNLQDRYKLEPSEPGRTAMDYRAYLLDEEGHITGVHELDCANDEEAKEKAVQLVDGHDVEVWQRERHIVRLKHHTRQ